MEKGEEIRDLDYLDKELLVFFELIEVALGARERLSRTPTEKEWRSLFDMAQKQTVAAFLLDALERLNRLGQRPPEDVLFEWIGLASQVQTLNEQMNQEAARLTVLFEKEKHRTAILKGQANASLYPNPLSRQPGDIDIWVDGGKERIVQTLIKLHLIDGVIPKYHSGNAKKSYHHIHLPMNENGIVVEVHFRPSSGNLDPFTNHRLQKFLNQEINRENELTKEGFRVPSLIFALVMQLAHIQRHLIKGEGIGLRQIIDYYYLLHSLRNRHTEKQCHTDNTDCTDICRAQEVLDSACIRRMGLWHVAGALMWVLHEKLRLEEEYLIAPMDERRGRMMLEEIMAGGNFGQYSPERQQGFSINGSLKYRLKKFRFFRFDARETIWGEINYARRFVTSIPERIRRKTWTLR